jgi:hypothetical protein
MVTNMFLLVFLFSALPLPSGVSESLGLSPMLGATIGTPSEQMGGNVAQEAMTVWLLSGDGKGSKGKDPQKAEETYDFGSDDVICSRYEISGDTLEELHGAITDRQNGAGPWEKKEEKRYAAYAIANYTVDYSPVLIGLTSCNGEVAVELGASAKVHREIHVHLPHFNTGNDDIEPSCRAEEARLLAHEMEHVKAYRLCTETMQDSIDSVRAIGHGSNFWSALMMARFELDRAVDDRMGQSIELANNINKAIDKLTNHGLNIGNYNNAQLS